MDFFNCLIYFWNKLPNHIKNNSCIENVKVKLDNFRKIFKKNLRGHFWELSNEFPNRIWFVFIFTNPSAQAGYDTRSIFKWSLTGLNSEFSFS